MVDQTKEGILIAEVNSFEESIKRANLGDFKTKAIVKDLEEVRGGIELNEEFYVTREIIRRRREEDKEREKKIKRWFLRIAVLSLVLVMGVMIDEECFGLLPLWVSTLVGKIFVVFLIIGMFVATYYEKRN